MKSLIISTKWELTDSRSNVILNEYKDIELYKNITRIIPGSWLVDRTEKIKLPFRTSPLEKNKIPDFTSIKSLSLYDCILERAKEIFNLHHTVYFLWSGGIDSTVALIGLLLSKPEKDRLIVVCNQDSLKENYYFYKNFIRDKFSIMSSEKLIQELKYSSISGIVINAEHGDLMYGQDFGQSMLKMFGSDYLNSPVNEKNIKAFFLKNEMTNEASDCWYDLFSSIDQYSPRSLNTMYDWSWWIGYNWRWQWAGEKFKLRFDNEINYETFFYTNEMQKWSVYHKQYPITKISDFKMDYKNIILDYDKNYDYFENKIKYVSRSFTHSSNAAAAIDGSGEKIKAKDFSIMDYYDPNNFMSRWLGA